MKAGLLRPALHAGSALILLTLLVSARTFRVALVALGMGAVVFEGLRLSLPVVRDAAARLVPVFRPREAGRPSGAAWLFLAYALCAGMPVPASMSAVLAGALADPAAAVIGTRLGGGRPKSWAGTMAAFATAAGALLLVARLPLSAAVPAAVVGALLERWPGPLDDNLVIAPGVGLAVWWLVS